MSEAVIAPFSVRLRGPHEQIDQDFPETARIGLLHLLCGWVEQIYVEDWKSIAMELQRIGRIRPVDYSFSRVSGQKGHPEFDAQELVMAIPWQKAFDFCERLPSYLATQVGYYTETGSWYTTVTRQDVQNRIAADISRLFLEERLAFEFKEGLVQRRGRSHSNEKLARADVVLGDPRLGAARAHWSKACKYFRDAKNPDPENAVKEAVCAVEAAGIALFPDQDGKTLGELVKSITGVETGRLPKAIAQTFHGLYGFRSGGDGVSHGGTAGGPVTPELAEYVLAVAASQIILLVDLAAALDPGVPF